MVQVVAALIWRDNRFMICQRPEYKARGLLWEFVGGKVEPGETKAQALVRECREELDVQVEVGTVFCEVDHVYPDLTIHLTLLNAAITQGEPTLLEHNAIAWIPPGGDRPIRVLPGGCGYTQVAESPARGISPVMTVSRKRRSCSTNRSVGSEARSSSSIWRRLKTSM